MENKLRKIISVFCVLVMVTVAFAAIGRNVKAEIETQTEYTEEEIENQFLSLLTATDFNMYISVEEDLNGNYKISFGSDNPGYYECTLTPTQVDYFMKSSDNINPMLGKEQQTIDSERGFLNPFVATDSNIHMAWQEKVDDNFEIFYTNDEGKQYENTLKQVRENLNGKLSENMDKAIECCLENDYKHSIVWVHKSIKILEKTENIETINTLVDSVMGFVKTNILYAEHDLTFNNTCIQEAYDKYYLAVDKYEKGNYDSAVEQFKNSYLKIVEAYEEKDEIFIGVDFGKIVRVSYTDYDSVAPEVFLNELISVGWMEVLPEENHMYYARSSNNGVSWWYFDATVHASAYLGYWGLSSSIVTPCCLIIIGIALLLLLLLLILIILALIIILIKCHFFYGILMDRTYGPIDDPYLNIFSPYDTVSVGDNIFNTPRICGGDGNGNGNGNGPEPAPDLTVTSIYFSDTYVLQEDPTTVYATIKNQGTATMSGNPVAYVEFRYGTSYDQGTTIDEVQIPAPLPPYPDPDCTTTVSVSWTPTTGASFDTTVYVMADSEGDVTEGNEGNNIGSVSCHVFNPTADDDDDGLTNDVEIKGEVTRYIVNKGDKGYLFYNVAPASYDKIFTYHTNPLEADTDLDGQNDYNDLVPLDYDMDGDGMINYPSIASPGSACYVERIAIAANNDPNLERADGSFVWDDDIDDDGTSLTDDWVWDLDVDGDGMPDKYEIKYGCTTESLNPDADGEFVTNQVGGNGWQHPWIYNSRYAILVGGDIHPEKKDTHEYQPDVYLPAFWNDINDMYNTLVDKGFIDDDVDYFGTEDDHVVVLFWDGTVDTSVPAHIDSGASVFTVRAAINSLATKVTKNDLFLFVAISHGGPSEFSMRTDESAQVHYCYYGVPPEKTLQNYEMNISEINVVPYGRSIVVIQSCNASGVIRNKQLIGTDGGAEWRTFMPLKAEDRIVIGSSRVDRYSYSTSGMYNWKFIHSFISKLGSGDVSVKSAFDNGKSAAGNDLPQLDDNGDALCEQNTDPSIGVEGEYVPGYVYDDGLMASYTYI